MRFDDRDIPNTSEEFMVVEKLKLMPSLRYINLNNFSKTTLVNIIKISEENKCHIDWLTISAQSVNNKNVEDIILALSKLPFLGLVNLFIQHGYAVNKENTCKPIKELHSNCDILIGTIITR